MQNLARRVKLQITVLMVARSLKKEGEMVKGLDEEEEGQGIVR